MKNFFVIRRDENIKIYALNEEYYQRSVTKQTNIT
jgi:hypothetical protein